ncbi:MAG: hypothetical protein AB7O62_17425 [Pirellulales bacterium]
MPIVAVVSCDGGRIRTRAEDSASASGVHGPAWHETKNASSERMHAAKIAAEDPCPDLSDTFRRVAHVAKIAETAAFSASDDTNGDSPREPYRGPERALLTCLASMACSTNFGKQMEGKAQRRLFFEPGRRMFIGDGLAWNWSIRDAHFPRFTAILDFIHAVQYLYEAAAAWELDDEGRWARYLEFTQAVWQGRVDEVIAAIEQELAARGFPGRRMCPRGTRFVR